jgi:hypothetical protein
MVRWHRHYLHWCATWPVSGPCPGIGEQVSHGGHLQQQVRYDRSLCYGQGALRASHCARYAGRVIGVTEAPPSQSAPPLPLCAVGAFCFMPPPRFRWCWRPAVPQATNRGPRGGNGPARACPGQLGKARGPRPVRRMRSSVGQDRPRYLAAPACRKSRWW